jgi:secondary thiamine-phosphate synthase enzyme
MSVPVVYCDSLEVSMDVGPDISDITHQLASVARRANVEEGSLHASVVGSTGSLTTIEYEPGVVEDLKRAITRLAPPGMEYEHEKAWHDGNGHSHVQAALLGPSCAIPVRNGELSLGTWQQAVIINHDNRARQRRVEVTVVGRSMAKEGPNR